MFAELRRQRAQISKMRRGMAGGPQPWWAVAAGVVALVALAGCSPYVDIHWGDNIGPSRIGLAYGTDRGCVSGPDHSCGGSQEVDIYKASSGGNKGTLVYFHSGGFISGDKAPLTHLGPIKQQLTNGYSIVSVNYRLAAGDRVRDGFPAMAADVASVLHWVRGNGHAHGLNTNKIVAVGTSAGGTLAGWAGVSHNSNLSEFANMPRIDGWISVSGILDWSQGPRSKDWSVILQGQAAADARGQSNTVLAQHDSNDPPGYLIHGDLDGFVEVGNARVFAKSKPSGTRNGTVTVDIVDVDSEGNSLDPYRGHNPLGGAHANALSSWLDAI